MNRRLVGLLAALCLLSACQDEPVGQMEPIPRPPGAQAPPPPPPAPTPAPERPDPSKVVLRWNLQEPTAFLATLSGATSGPAAQPAPAPRRGKKGKAAPEQPAATPAASGREQKILFLLSKTEAGEPTVLLLPQDGGEEDRASMSERGFVLDGLSGQMHNLAVLMLELPADPIGPGAQWRLAANLVDTTGVPGFTPADSQQKNEVKLVSLTPGADGEQVATLAYELTQSVSGRLRSEGGKGGKGVPEDEEADEEDHDHEEHDHDHGHEQDSLQVTKMKTAAKAAQKASMSTKKPVKTRAPGTPASAEMRVTGRGEFLVKAGQWRTWEATLTTRTTGGLALPGAPAGERTVRLSPVKPIPPEALQKLVKK